MEKYNADFWIRFSPIFFMIFLGLIIVWVKWPEEKARMKKCRERREQRERNKKDGVTDLALMTMPVWMDDNSSDVSSSSSSDYDSSSSDFD